MNLGRFQNGERFDHSFFVSWSNPSFNISYRSLDTIHNILYTPLRHQQLRKSSVKKREITKNEIVVYTPKVRIRMYTHVCTYTRTHVSTHVTYVLYTRRMITGINKKLKQNFFFIIRYLTIRLLLALSIQLGLDVDHLDVTTAFLNSNLKEKVYMDRSPGHENKWKGYISAPCMFYRKKNDNLVIITIYVTTFCCWVNVKKQNFEVKKKGCSF